jgi:hypothetical protein
MVAGVPSPWERHGLATPCFPFSFRDFPQALRRRLGNFVRSMFVERHNGAIAAAPAISFSPIAFRLCKGFFSERSLIS